MSILKSAEKYYGPATLNISLKTDRNQPEPFFYLYKNTLFIIIIKYKRYNTHEKAKIVYCLIKFKMLSKVKSFNNILKHLSLELPIRCMSIFITKSQLANKNLHKTPFEKSEKIVSDIELNKMRQFTEIVDNIFLLHSVHNCKVLAFS